MAKIVAESGAGVVLMHMQGTPATRESSLAAYINVVIEVYDFLAHRVEWAVGRGISRDQIAIDPGIGFGKTIEHNLEKLRNLEQFANLESDILVGVSRKGFLGSITGRPVQEQGRLECGCIARRAPARLARPRVHDAAKTADAIRVWSALLRWENRL